MSDALNKFMQMNQPYNNITYGNFPLKGSDITYIKTRYMSLNGSESGSYPRYYHDFSHIVAMLTLCDILKIENRTLRFAILFHDIYYNPFAPAGFNENTSANIAESFALINDLKDSGIGEYLTLFIRATAYHLKTEEELRERYPPTNEQLIQDVLLLLDLDLFTFGLANYSVFKEYSNWVKMEYTQSILEKLSLSNSLSTIKKHEILGTFDSGRYEFLKQLSERGPIFRSKEMSPYNLFAEKNIKAAMAGM